MSDKKELACCECDEYFEAHEVDELRADFPLCFFCLRDARAELEWEHQRDRAEAAASEYQNDYGREG